MNYLKDSFLDLVERFNIAMTLNINKVLVKHLKGSILDLAECCLCLCDAFLFQ